MAALLSVRYALEILAKACVVALLVLLLRVFVWAVNLLLLAPLSDPLQYLPGPRGKFLESHLEQVMNASASPTTHKNWRFQFGQTFRFHGFGRHDLRLMTFDTRALAHILNSTTYEKPWQTRSFLGRLIGNGIFSVEGAEHTKQRRIIGPAFSQEAIKRMHPVFVSKAQEVTEQWKDVLDVSKQVLAEKSHGVIIDVANWMSRAAFDVIGLAGFAQDFRAIQSEQSEVYAAYRKIFNIADEGLGPREILELYFPVLRKIWLNDEIRTANEAFKTIHQSGKSSIAERKDMAKLGRLDEKSDLLSILVASNLSDKSSKRLTDRELVDQCSTFLMAGSDSVSVALSWCFHLLALHPEVQIRLRDELSSIQNFHPGGFDEPKGAFEPAAKALEGVRYLDNFVKEVLRLCPPVHATIRVATSDDIIPVSVPVASSNGKGDHYEDFVKIRKGTYIHIPIEGLSYSEDIWGADALQFNPDRWNDTESTPSRPGLLNLMTFGAGNHSCLGYRFTMGEMKVFLAVLVPRFRFTPPPDIEIGKFNCVLTRPYVRGKLAEEGFQLPVKIHLID